MKVKTNVKAGDSVKIIAFASFVVLAVALGAPQNVRAQVTVPVGPPVGQDVNIAWCHPSTGVLSVSIVINHAGTWVDFLAGAYEYSSGQVVTDQRSWIRHGPSDDVVIGYDEISFLYPWSVHPWRGWWAPFVHYRIWDPSSMQWLHGFYWVTFGDGSSWCWM
jgi:hypothetical protein